MRYAYARCVTACDDESQGMGFLLKYVHNETPFQAKPTNTAGVCCGLVIESVMIAPDEGAKKWLMTHASDRENCFQIRNLKRPGNVNKFGL